VMSRESKRDCRHHLSWGRGQHLRITHHHGEAQGGACGSAPQKGDRWSEATQMSLWLNRNSPKRKLLIKKAVI